MSLDARTAEGKLTPEERRTMLRAFADRMLLKTTQMDDPEDMAGVEKAVRVVSAIERIYSRCDRAEKHAPDPRKLEAERATNHSNALKARVALASDLEWGEQRRAQLGKWWDAADTTVQPQISAPASAPADSEIGPVLDTLIDDLDALTDAVAAGQPHTPRRVYPPAKAAPFACPDDECYAMTKAMYDNLRRLYELKAAGASP